MTTPTTTRMSRKGDSSTHECTCHTTNTQTRLNSSNASAANFDELKHCIEKCVENFTIKSSHKHPPIIVMLGLPPTTPTPTPTQSHLGPCQCKQIQSNVVHGSGSDYSMISAKTSTPSASSKYRSSSNHFTGLSRIETKPEPFESIYKLNETRESLERKKFTSSKDYVVIDNKTTTTTQLNGGRSKSASVYEKINSQIDKALHMNNNSNNNNNKTYSTLTHVTPLAETLLSNTQSTLINNNNTKKNTNDTNNQTMQRYESLENIYKLNEQQNVSSRREEQERLKSKILKFLKRNKIF